MSEKEDSVAIAVRVGDWLAWSITITTFFAWLPRVAAILSIVWMAIRIWETNTVQCVVARIRGKARPT